MNRKLRLVQVGIRHEHAAGKITSARKLSDIFEIIGVVDEKDFATTPSFSGVDLNAYGGIPFLRLDEALSAQPDVALIETPNNDLVPTAELFAQRNVALHMDKPAGESLEPYRDLLDLCHRKDLPFQMGYMFRTNPAFCFALKAVREGWLGEILTIEADMNHCYGGEEYQRYLGNFKGGIMYNLGCHLIDAVAAMMGRPQKVTSILKPSVKGDSLNNSLAVIEYEHALAVISACSRDTGNTQGRRMRISGTEGIISFSPQERFSEAEAPLTLSLRRSVPGYSAGIHTVDSGVITDRYAPQLIELAGMIRGQTSDPYNRTHDLLVHEITLAAAGYTKWS